MVVEDHEATIGWPFGLRFLNTRPRMLESLPAAAVDRYSLHLPSTSFSSISSSNLDTESSASFFQDHSVSLGRLIGIKPGERGRLYFTNSKQQLQGSEKISVKGSNQDTSKRQGGYHVSDGICIPLLLGALVKMNLNRKKSRKQTDREIDRLSGKGLRYYA